MRADPVDSRSRTAMAAPIAAIAALAAAALAAAALAAADRPAAPEKPVAVFSIGEPDGLPLDFGLAEEGWPAFAARFPGPVEFTVGSSPLDAWPAVHPSTEDGWAGGKAHAFAIRFRAGPEAARNALTLTIGLADSHPSPSTITVTVNGMPAGARRAPPGSGAGAWRPADGGGTPSVLVFPVPAGLVREGGNELAIALSGGSWIVYDFVALASEPRAVAPPALAESAKAALARVPEIVFAVRRPRYEHWYANFGYYAPDEKRKAYGDGGRLAVLDVRTGSVKLLVDDPRGAVRDPAVDHDGRTILFSWRKGGEDNYHLWEIRADGSGRRQVTDGPWDDFESEYLPDGGIAFLSSRCKRWVNCWLTQVAVLHRMERDGSGLRPISSNNEQDNTPAVLPDGRILYTRWEYVDRSQVDYHHLWTVNPDGSDQQVFYGNLHPGTVMIDARPIPGTPLVAAIFSPGHGDTEHAGSVAIVDPRSGPDEQRSARLRGAGGGFRDVYPLSADCFLVARNGEILAMDPRGRTETLHALADADLKAGLWCHEPRPLVARPREPVVAPRSRESAATGTLVLSDVHEGRSMAGVRRGEVKKLLVLESLPKPINYTGGMEPLSYGGTFTLERVLGTVPVEEDGSASFVAPALRSLIFVALDERDLAVKRMQSFVTVQPGETVGCAGCHEARTRAAPRHGVPLALRRAPSAIAPVPGVPDVFDFPRDIQPILDRHCLPCHGYERTERGGPRAGGAILAGDRGPVYSQSYFTLSALRQLADGRNLARSNYPPRALGSGGSKLLAKVDGHHKGVAVSERERTVLRLWIDAGAPFPGTYAALGSGMIGGYRENSLDRSDLGWPATKAAREVMARRCSPCHRDGLRLPISPSDDMGMPPWDVRYDDPRLRFSRDLVYDLSRPERSLLLLGPLARDAGGWGTCRPAVAKDAAAAAAPPVFASTADPDYRAILASVVEAKRHLEEMGRFDMPGFRPPAPYVREMRRFGILPAGAGAADPVDPYAADRAYWDSLAWRPAAAATVPVPPEPPRQAAPDSR